MAEGGEAMREEVAQAARRLETSHLSVGTSGNVSRRTEDGFLITPSAVPYERLTAEEIVELGLEGERLVDPGRPSTEWPFHAAIYRERPEVEAIVHAHPPYTTALSCVRREIPAFHYLVGIAGGRSIRCAGYARPGSETLAALAVKALEGRTACLLANHGMISLGSSLEAALALAQEVENLGRQYWLALQIGEPAVLSSDEMEEILRHLESYRTCEA